MVAGVAYTQLPDDLFIPPDALEVLLDSFSGPLDLLLYLIRKQNIDILDIPMMSITKQYLHYIDIMASRRLELAADYLLMAAMLAEIKSRLLLPSTTQGDEALDEDPRMALVRRLQAYEQIKQAAQLLDLLPRQDRDHFIAQVNLGEVALIKSLPSASVDDLLESMKALITREDQFTHHEISRQTLSVRERMSQVLLQLQAHQGLEFIQLCLLEEGRMGLVVTFLAVLELARQSLIVITQAQSFSPIHIQAA